jgi:hypothetical protein
LIVYNGKFIDPDKEALVAKGWLALAIPYILFITVAYLISNILYFDEITDT